MTIRFYYWFTVIVAMIIMIYMAYCITGSFIIAGLGAFGLGVYTMCITVICECDNEL